MLSDVRKAFLKTHGLALGQEIPQKLVEVYGVSLLTALQSVLMYRLVGKFLAMFPNNPSAKKKNLKISAPRLVISISTVVISISTEHSLSIGG